MADVERADEVLRQNHREAEDAAARLATALQVAGLAELPSLRPVFAATGIRAGAHVELGGCSARRAKELADVLTAYARLTGRLVDGQSTRMLHEVLGQLGVTPALPSDGVYVVRTDQQ